MTDKFVAEDETAMTILRRMRADGWSVAVHNDYQLAGEAHTFWLFTRDGRAVKGEGPTDEHALTLAFAEANVIKNRLTLEERLAKAHVLFAEFYNCGDYAPGERACELLGQLADVLGTTECEEGACDAEAILNGVNQ